MPAAALKNLAARSDKSIDDLERYWDEAKVAAKEKGFSEDEDRFWAYVMGIVKTRAGLKESLEEMILHVLDVIYEADEEPEKPADDEEGDGAPVGMNRLEKIAMERGLSEEEVMKYWEAAKKKAMTWAEEKQADPETMMGYALKVLREMLPPKPEPEPEEIDAPPEESGPVTKDGEDKGEEKKEKTSKEKTDDAVAKAEKEKGVEKEDDKEKEEKPEEDDKKKKEVEEGFVPAKKGDTVLMVNPKSGKEVVVHKSAIKKQQKLGFQLSEAMGNVMDKKEMAALKKAGIDAGKLTPKQRDAAIKKLKNARGAKKGSLLGGLGALFTGIGVGVIAGKALDSAFSLFKHG